jgi:ribonuclease Z
MLPKPPPREPSLGFLYVPPFRIQGLSVAGEASVVQVPELDVCFDMGVCPRAVLPSRCVAISHGHMDHVGGLAYFCSQRRFQGIGTATIVCDARIARAVHAMMAGYVELEQQRTPYEVIALDDGGQVEIKNNVLLRGFFAEHTSPSMGFVVVERRSKLRPEYLDLPQEKLRELKSRGVEITRTLEVPLVAYLGDTGPGPHLLRADVRQAKVVICECTFFEPEHKGRSRVGQHMHVDDVGEWLPLLEGDALVITHVSRRTSLVYAKQRLAEVIGPERAQRVLMLMDYRANRERYDRQARLSGASQGEAGG